MRTDWEMQYHSYVKPPVGYRSTLANETLLQKWMSYYFVAITAIKFSWDLDTRQLVSTSANKLAEIVELDLSFPKSKGCDIT